MCIDPDERLEKNAAGVIRSLIKETSKVIYGFKLRSLWDSPDQYRVDGFRANSVVFRLFPLLEGQVFLNRALHCPWYPMNDGYEKIPLDLNLYHLKTMLRADRLRRTRIYKTLDPRNEYNTIQYEDLADETGMVLEKIPLGREFVPPIILEERRNSVYRRDIFFKIRGI